MADYLLDSNHLSFAIRKVSLLRERIYQEHRSGNRFITCYPVLCELEVGMQQTKEPEEYRRRLHQLLRHLRLWPLDDETTKAYGTIYHQLRTNGRALSQVDMMLAAMARQHQLKVLTTDLDFQALTDIRTENWTT